MQIQISSTTASAIITILTFIAGVSLPIFATILFGHELIKKYPFMSKHSYTIRRLLGTLIFTIALIGYFEFSLNIPNTISNTEKQSLSPPTQNNDTLINGLAHPYTAPDLKNITRGFNSKPLSLNSLRGKVVLIDFWTYSCINCIRTLPYIKSWYEKYKDKGLVVIGIHSPKFFFEHKLDNVSRAIEDLKITYPVALDNSFATWQSYSNHYWPAHYLINKKGKIVYTHFGEGDYDIIERNIRFLLSVKDDTVNMQKNLNESPIDRTPETYLGLIRTERLKSQEATNQTT